MKKKQKLLIPSLICAVAASFYIYDYILRVMPEAMTHSLMQDFNLSAAGLGMLASLFFWGYAPMQIPVGILFDKYSARSLLTVTLFLSSVAATTFGLTDNFFIAGIARFVMGVTTAFSFVGALVVGANWFRGQYFAMYTGLVQFLGCIGAILGIAPVVYLVELYGRGHASLLIACLGYVLTILMWLVVRDAPKRAKPAKKPALKTVHTTDHSSYRAAFSNPQTWWVGLYGFSIWSPVTVFAVLWGVPYLHDVYQLSQIDASSLISIIWLTIAFAGPLVGWFSKRIQRRRIPMRICALSGLAACSGLLFLPHLSTHLITLLLMLFGIGAAGLVLAFGLVVDLQHPKAVGAVVGFTNMAVIFGGVVLQPAVGFIIHRLWVGAMSTTGIHIYSKHTYELALLMLPASFFIALLTTFLVKETCCQAVHRY